MSRQATEREARKRLLLAQSAVLRLSLAQQLNHGLQPAWRTLDRVDHGWRWVRRHPWLWAGAAAALLVWRPSALGSGLSAAGRLVRWGRWCLRWAPVVLPLISHRSKD